MSCHRVRDAIASGAERFDGPLGLHAETCGTCRDELELERWLLDSFAVLREEVPAPVDVVRTVADRIDAMTPPRRVEHSVRHLAWAGLAAAAAILAVLFGGYRLFSKVGDSMGVLGTIGDAVLSILGGAAGAVAAVLRAPLELAGSAGETLLASNALSTAVLSVTWWATVAAASLMTLTVAVVLGRELWAPDGGAREIAR